MDIIRLQPDDTEAFLAFSAAGLASDSNAFRYAPEDDVVFGASASRERLKRDVVLVARKDEAWLGVGGLARFAGSRLDHKGLIWGMYVAPNARGTSLADRIMDALIDSAHTALRQLQLTVMADNQRARAFYERHGFEAYATEPASVRRSNRYTDEILMWRRL